MKEESLDTKLVMELHQKLLLSRLHHLLELPLPIGIDLKCNHNLGPPLYIIRP